LFDMTWELSFYRAMPYQAIREITKYRRRHNSRKCQRNELTARNLTNTQLCDAPR